MSKIKFHIAMMSIFALMASSCGGGGEGQLAGSVPVLSNANYQPTAEPLGGFKVGCGTQQNQQPAQQQIPFKQQQQQTDPTSCSPQFQFYQSKFSDFDVQIDCDNNRVNIKSSGPDQQSKNIPIQSDGSVKGDLQYQQQVQNDGKGNVSCWVETVVNFNGQADCSKKTLNLDTQAQFHAASKDQIPSAMGVPPVITSPTPSASPSASPAPTLSPAPSPTPSPSPTVTQVTVCVVQNPCPIVGSGELSCPKTQP